MPARLAFPFIYRHIARRLDEDQLLELHAIMGDPRAEGQIAERRRRSATTMGLEIG